MIYRLHHPSLLLKKLPDPSLACRSITPRFIACSPIQRSIYLLKLPDPSLACRSIASWSIACTIHRSFLKSFLIHRSFADPTFHLPSKAPWSIACSPIHRSFHCSLIHPWLPPSIDPSNSHWSIACTIRRSLIKDKKYASSISSIKESKYYIQRKTSVDRVILQSFVEQNSCSALMSSSQLIKKCHSYYSISIISHNCQNVYFDMKSHAYWNLHFSIVWMETQFQSRKKVRFRRILKIDFSKKKVKCPPAGQVC